MTHKTGIPLQLKVLEVYEFIKTITTVKYPSLLSLSLSLSLSLCLLLYFTLPTSLSLCLYLSLFLPSLSACLSLLLSLSLSLSLSMSLFLFVSFCLCLSPPLSVFLLSLLRLTMTPNKYDNFTQNTGRQHVRVFFCFETLRKEKRLYCSPN